MNTIFHSSDSRGGANHGWLKAKHSFSFSDYYDNSRMHFGKLRVLNDDVIAPATGFDIHPHQDMEIITIPLSGSLKHGDNMGHEEIITPGEVQVMSAGTGIWHSEHNASASEPLNLFQIWIFSDNKGHKPRYNQKMFSPENVQNKWQLFVSPDGRDNSLWIHQNAFISMIYADKGMHQYAFNDKRNGVYFMMVEGSADLVNNKLNKRDAIGIWDADDTLDILFFENSQLMAIEVPMN
ncbi:MAG: pirin family protein [Prolixibacteraceae bacterium]|nr:pirin family protein [Prolixibacteraceae bacterium]